MRWLILVLSILLLFIIQDAVAATIGPAFYLNPALIFAFFASLFLPKAEGVAAAVVTGLGLDLASGLPDGLMVVSVLLSAGVIHYTVHQVITRELNPVILHGAVALGIGCFYLFLWTQFQVLEYFSLENTPQLIISWQKLLLDIGLNTMLTYPVYLYYNYSKALKDKYSFKT